MICSDIEEGVLNLRHTDDDQNNDFDYLGISSVISAAFNSRDCSRHVHYRFEDVYTTNHEIFRWTWRRRFGYRRCV